MAALLNTREHLGGLVFTSALGQIGNPHYSLESIAKTSGVKFMAHDLRRTFAAMSGILGHSGLKAPREPQDPRRRDRRLSGNHHGAPAHPHGRIEDFCLEGGQGTRERRGRGPPGPGVVTSQRGLARFPIRLIL